MSETAQEISARAYTVSDDQWTVFEDHFFHGCCDCGLSHRVDLRRVGDSHEIRFEHLSELTKQSRVDHYHPLHEELCRLRAENQRLQADKDHAENVVQQYVTLWDQAERKLTAAQAEIARLREEIGELIGEREDLIESRDERDAQIARLSSPPEERMDIVERHQKSRLDCFPPSQVDEDFDTLLQDAARYRNALDVLLAEKSNLLKIIDDERSRANGAYADWQHRHERLEQSEVILRGAYSLAISERDAAREKLKVSQDAFVHKCSELYLAEQRIERLEQRIKRLNEALVVASAEIHFVMNALHEEPDREDIQFSQQSVDFIVEVLSEQPALAGAPSCEDGQSPLADGQKTKRTAAPLHLTGHQVNSLREFTDGDPDFEIVIQELPERTAGNGDHMQAGLYVWSADYPDEGVMLLEESGNG